MLSYLCNSPLTNAGVESSTNVAKTPLPAGCVSMLNVHFSIPNLVIELIVYR